MRKRKAITSMKIGKEESMFIQKLAYLKQWYLKKEFAGYKIVPDLGSSLTCEESIAN